MIDDRRYFIDRMPSTSINGQTPPIDKTRAKRQWLRLLKRKEVLWSSCVVGRDKSQCSELPVRMYGQCHVFSVPECFASFLPCFLSHNSFEAICDYRYPWSQENWRHCRNTRVRGCSSPPSSSLLTIRNYYRL